MQRLQCPVCSCTYTETLLSLNCGNLDNSKLYPTVRLMACSTCGHAFNELSSDEVSGLGEYYNMEYAPANLNSVVKEGDLPGSTGKFTHGRYEQLYQVLSPYLDSHSTVLDVGCAVGGFLDFLRDKGCSKLYGVDMIEAYVERARQKNYAVEQGCAECLPFENKMFDALVIEQVLEHLVNPAVAFREAGRVLKQGGILCIGVPDAARYSEFYFFDFYWLLMREHIQHFDINSLRRLAAAEGFELLSYQQNSHPIMGEKMIMPNLCAVFRYQGPCCITDEAVSQNQLSQILKRYVENENERLSNRKAKLDAIAMSKRPLYAWGVGREFLYLYEAAGIKQCNLTGIIDMNPFKQRTASVNQMSISSVEVLEEAGKDSIMLITAIAHKESITKVLRDIAFKGETVSLI
jgi:SAM-dependent methyltransferase